MSHIPCTIYHNPRCSKSREALELLKQSGIELTVIEYLKTPPSVKELQKIVQLLNVPATDMLRKKETEYKALGLGNKNITQDAMLSAVAENPILLERPIVVMGGRAIIARPPSLLETEGFI